MNHQEQKQEEKEGKQEEQQSFFFVPIQPIQPIQSGQAARVALPASFPPVESLFPSSSSAVPPLTDAYLRKRTVHQVAHGVPYSEQKRSKFAQP